MEPTLPLAGFVGAAWIVTKAVEQIRKSFPRLDGLWVNLLAIGIGIGIAFGAGTALPAFTPYPWPLDKLIVGFALGTGAGWLADLAGRSGPRSRTGTNANLRNTSTTTSGG